MKKRPLLGFLLVLFFIAGVTRPATLFSQTVDATGLFTAIRAASTDTIVHGTMTYFDIDADGNFDANFVLSAGPIIAWGDYSACLTFYDEGIKVRSGSAFTNTNNITISAGTQFDVWVDVNMTKLTYNTWVKSAEMAYPGLVHADAGFRRTAIDSIARWSTLHNTASEPDTIGAVTVEFVNSIPGLDVSTLKGITLDLGTLNPVFDAAVTTYDVTLPNGTTTVNVTAETSVIGAKITGNGAVDVSSGTGTAAIEVTSFNGTSTTTYTVNFTVSLLSDDATLSALSVDTGILDPAFNPNTTNYTVTVPKGTTSVTVTAIATDATASLTGAGVVDVSTGTGTASVFVTAEDGVSTKTYTVVINIEQSDDATLSALTVDAGTLTPAFDKAVTAYTVLAPFGTSSVNVTATTTDANATVTGTGAVDVSSGSGTASIVVTAEDATTTKTYTVVINVKKSDDATLSALTVDAGTLSPAFNKAVTAYTVLAPYGTSSVNVTATATDANATVTGTGVVDVSSGSGSASVVVTAEDATTTSTYTVDITVDTNSGIDNRESSIATVYPTISNGSFIIRFANSPGTITVYDFSGKAVFSKMASSLVETINVNNVGAYLIKVDSEGSSKVFKVIRTK